MFNSLGGFLQALAGTGELQRITAEVSPLLEVTEIADRHSKSRCAHSSTTAASFDPNHADLGGKALLFEKITGCDFPLAINVFGSYRRMEMALGVDHSGAGGGGFESIAQRLAALTTPAPPRSLRDAFAMARRFFPMLRIGPKRARTGPCQEVVKLTSRNEVDLTRLPLIKCWPFDGDPRQVGIDVSPEQAGTAAGQGRYITFAGMHTVHYEDRDDPRPRSHNIGMYRAQLVDATRLVMHWHMHHDGAAHWRSWKAHANGQPMPIAICFGGEAVLPYAATAPLPPGMSELLMAGFLNGRGIPMVRAKTVPLWVPANSEIVIEGFVSTECGDIGFEVPRLSESDENAPTTDTTRSVALPLGPGAAFEGPFGDHTGYYSMPDRYPLVNVTAVTHRRNAVFPATVVGLPPQEDYYLGKATERIFLPLLKVLIPDILDYHLPMFGCFHNCAFIKIRKAYPLQARRVMHAVWGAGQMAWTKFIIVVDDDVDVHDEPAVLRAVFRHCDFARDLEAASGPLDILDHAAPYLGAGGKLGFDATRKIPGEECGHDRGLASPPRAPAEVVLLWKSKQGDARLLPDFGEGRCAFVSVDKREPGDGARAIEAVWKDSPDGIADLVIAVDREGLDLSDWQSVLFRWCANTDPIRDRHGSGKRIGFDATRKIPGVGDERNGRPVRAWPPIIGMSEDVKQRIDARRSEFGL